MSKYERAGSLDSGTIDTETGEFPMVMATEGEASDGHIISVRGLEFPEEMPLQLDHGRGAISNLGIVSRIRKDTIGGVPVVRGVGQIRLTGDGPALAARRDLVDGIARGHIRGVSLTWDAVKAVERRDLPRSHPAHVSKSEADPRKRFGLYFEKSRGIEQSIVAIPADREAMIGRAETASDEMARAMWQTLASRLDDAPTRSRELEIINALEAKVADLEERLQREASESESDHSPIEPPALDVFLRSLQTEIRSSGERYRADLHDAVGEVFLHLTGKQL